MFLGSNKETLREAFPVCAAFAASLHIRPPRYHLLRTREVKIPNVAGKIQHMLCLWSWSSVKRHLRMATFHFAASAHVNNTARQEAHGACETPGPRRMWNTHLIRNKSLKPATKPIVYTCSTRCSIQNGMIGYTRKKCGPFVHAIKVKEAEMWQNSCVREVSGVALPAGNDTIYQWARG